MIRFLILSLLTLIGNVLGLFAAAAVLPGFHIQPLGFIVSVLFFSAVEIFFEPFITSMSVRYMPALSGGVALITTLVGLLLTVTFTNGLQIDGLGTWLIAPLIIWLVAVLASIVLPMFMFKKTLQRRNGGTTES